MNSHDLVTLIIPFSPIALWCINALLKLLQLSPEVGVLCTCNIQGSIAVFHFYTDGGSCQGDELGFEKIKSLPIRTPTKIMHQI